MSNPKCGQRGFCPLWLLAADNHDYKCDLTRMGCSQSSIQYDNLLKMNSPRTNHPKSFLIKKSRTTPRRHKLSEEFVRGLPFKSAPVRDTEVKGLMVLCHKQTKTYAVQGDIWKHKRKIKSIRITLGRTDRVSLRVARAKAREVMATISKGQDPTAPSRSTSLTLDETWTLYREANVLSPKTQKEYAGHLSRYLKKWQRRPLAELGNDRRMVRERHEQLTAKHGPYAANHAMRTFRALYNYALREDPNLPPNPAIAVTFNKEARRDWAMAKDALPAWWKKVHTLSPIVRDLHILFLFTGLRRTDACTIQETNFDLDQGTLYVPSPKGGAERAFTLPLSEYLVQVLIARCQENTILFPDSPWMFPSISRSGHIEEPKRQGLPSPHAYRHTYRTLALEAGIPYTETCLLLNHKRRDVSYGYISPRALTNHLKSQQERMTAFLLSAAKSMTVLAS